MLRYFDTRNERLIYLSQEATPDFWDETWKAGGLTREGIIQVNDTFVTRITKKYLSPEDGIILEGGCGPSRHVAALANNGFHCIGIDSASKTVKIVNQLVPELDVRLGDVRRLQFESAYFTGYWSLGVIEHFWSGYDLIAQEMKRVLKPGGILFLAFPYLSTLRKLKIRRGSFEIWEKEDEPSNFYQFALDHEQVLAKYLELGFILVDTKPLAGLKGLKDEISIGKQLLQTWNDYRGQSILLRGGRYLFSQLVSRWTGHSILLILRRGE